MQKLKNEMGLADLPAPVALTPDQLMAVAAGTAMQLKGTSLLPVIVAGGIFGPMPIPQLPTMSF